MQPGAYMSAAYNLTGESRSHAPDFWLQVLVSQIAAYAQTHVFAPAQWQSL